MTSSSQASLPVSTPRALDPLLPHLKQLPPALKELTFPELFFNPRGQPKRQITSSEQLSLELVDPNLRNLYLNDSGSPAPRRCFALLRREELLLFAVTPDKLLPLGSRLAASMGSLPFFVSCDRPFLQQLFPFPLWERVAALDSSSEELLIAESSPIGALRSWAEPGKEELLFPSLFNAFPELKGEVDLNLQDNRRRTALHRAALTGDIEAAILLIKAGAEKNPKDLDGKTPLHLATTQGDQTMVEALLNSGCDPLALTFQEENLLYLALSQDSPPLTSFLLQQPSALIWLSQEDSDGKRPLHRAVWGEPKPGLVDLLLRAGAEANATNHYGYTALHWAAKHGHLESARLLLSFGARIDLINQNGESPIDLALQWGQEAVVWLLIGGKGGELPHFVSQEAVTSEGASSSGPHDLAGAAYFEFEKAYESGELLPQIFWLERLGKLHIDRREYLKAAHCLNGALSIIFSHPSDFEGRRELLLRLFTSQLERVEGLFLEDRFQRKSPADHRGYLMGYRERLDSIRSQFAEQIERGVLINEAQEFISQNYQSLLVALIQESMSLIGQKVPSGFAVMGLGSMARMEMSPYSDLEFAFLIKNPSPGRLDYFRKLSDLLTLKMVNMGETKCELIRFKRGRNGAEDRPARSLVPTGFSLDIGGLSPSGKQGVYELIGAPQQLAQFQTVAWLSRNDAEIILVNALTTFSYLIGDPSLVDSYRAEIKKILNATIGGFWKRKRLREDRAFQLMRGFLDEFQPKINQDKVDLRAFDIKKELYRLPQMVVSGLVLYYGLKGANTLERIEELRRKRVFSQEGSNQLKRAFQSILKLRAEAHLFYQTEKEILYHPRAEERDQERLLTISSEIGQQLLEIYRTLIPLHEGAQAFLAGNPEILARSALYSSSIGTYNDSVRQNLDYEMALHSALERVAFNPDSPSQSSLGRVHEDIGQLEKALESFEESYHILKKKHGDQPHSDTASCLNELGNVYRELANYKRSIECHQESLAISKEIQKEKPDEGIAISLMGLGNNKLALGQYTSAIDYYLESLAIRKEIWGDQSDKGIATNLNNLGGSYQLLGDYRSALQYYEQALKMNRELYKDQPHPEIIMNLNNLGSLYNTLGERGEAVERLEEALAMSHQIYPMRPHPLTASTLGQLGLAYLNSGEIEKANRYLEESLTLEKRIYNNNPHPNIANRLHNLAKSYSDSGNYKQAIELYEQSLAMKKEIFNDKPHPDIALTLNGLGDTHRLLGHYECSIDLLQKGLEIYEQFYNHRPNTGTAHSLMGLGIAYGLLGKGHQSIEYSQKALTIFKEIHGDTPHLEIASNYYNLGTAFSGLELYDDAIEHYQHSLTIYRQIHGERPHEQIAHTLYDLGSTFQNLKRYSDAIEHYKQSLAIYQEIYGDTPHERIASNLEALGYLYQELNDHHLAIQFYQKSLTLYRELYSESPHPEIASLLSSLGLIYCDLSEYEYAIDSFKESLAIYQELYSNQPHSDIAKNLNLLGFTYYHLNQHHSAIDCYHRSLAIYKEIDTEKNNSNHAGILGNLALVYSDLNDYDHAIEYHQLSLEINRQIHGDHPHLDIARGLNNLGEVYRLLGQFERAIEHCNKSLNIVRQIHGNAPQLLVASILGNLGNSHYSMKEYNRAIELYEEEWIIAVQLYGDKSHSYLSSICNNLGNVYYSIGNYNSAIEYYSHSLKMNREIYGGKPHSSIANNLNNLGNVYADLSDYDRSIDHYQQALTIYRQIYSDSHPQPAITLSLIGDTYRAQGDFEKAIEAYSESYDLLIQILGAEDPMSKRIEKKLVFLAEVLVNS